MWFSEWQRRTFWLAGLLLLIGTVCSAKPSLNKKIRFSVEKYKLDNGLTVLLHEDHSAPIFSFHQWYRVGSKNERPGRTGLAHFFEHLMFKGTPKYSAEKLESIIQANGGRNNAFTSRDYTGYYEDMPSGKLELVMDIESDRMRHLIFDKERVKKEREVVKEERRMRVENQVYGYLNEAIYGTAYRVHPYRWPVIGYMKDLNAATIEDLKEFYRINYAPNNAVIVVAGDFNSDQAKKLIKKYYGSIPSQPLKRTSYKQEPEQKGHREKTLVKNVQSATFALAYKISKAGDPDSYALDLLASILGSGTSSRLYKRLVYQLQLATSASAWAQTPQDPGLFNVFVSMRPGQSLDKAINVAYGEIYKLRLQLVSEKELAKAKNQVMKSYVDSMKTISGKAQSLAINEILFGDYSRLFSDLDLYQSVTREQIQAVANKYLQPQQRSLIKVVPPTTEGA